MKYVIFDEFGGFPVLFGKSWTHRDIADKFPEYRVISAGFIIFQSSGVACYGKSITLNIESNPEEDRIIINRELDIIE